MTDLIERQAAIDRINKQREHLRPDIYEQDYIGDAAYKICAEFIRRLPSAQQWIPCSERLPEDDTLMLVNYIDRRPDAVDIWIGWHEMENVWYIDGEEHSKECGNEVVAWMPLPDPLKGDNE